MSPEQKHRERDDTGPSATPVDADRPTADACGSRPAPNGKSTLLEQRERPRAQGAIQASRQRHQLHDNRRRNQGEAADERAVGTCRRRLPSGRPAAPAAAQRPRQRPVGPGYTPPSANAPQHTAATASAAAWPRDGQPVRHVLRTRSLEISGQKSWAALPEASGCTASSSSARFGAGAWSASPLVDADERHQPAAPAALVAPEQPLGATCCGACARQGCARAIDAPVAELQLRTGLYSSSAVAVASSCCSVASTSAAASTCSASAVPRPRRGCRPESASSATRARP